MDKLVFEKQSEYAKIQIFEDIHDKHITLSLDRYVQFEEGRNEQVYHNVLTAPLKENIENINKVVILGGGDGLVARNLLRLKPELKITLVDIDKDVVELCRENPRIKKINEGSLDKINIVIDDARKWVLETKDKFDAAILDFPDPTSKELEALFTQEFYRDVNRILKDGGIVSIQAGGNWLKTFDNALNVFKRTGSLNYNMYNSKGYIIYGRSGYKDKSFQELLPAGSK